MTAGDQGEVFAAYIARELDAERDRRKTLDARGVSVVTVSAALVALLSAASGFASAATDVEPPESAIGPLTIALLALAAAAACGILATFLWKYNVANTTTLNKMVNEKWPTTEVDARNSTAQLDVIAISSLRSRNAVKARFIIAALMFQVAGLIALAIAVYKVLQEAA